MTMHSSRKVFLLDNEPRCVLATYEKDEGPLYNTKKVKTTEYKTFDDDVAVDDLVIVKTNTRHGFTVVKVKEVDVEPDLDSSDEINWVVSRFDTGIYEGIIKKEEEFLSAVRKAEKTRRKAELKKDFLADADASVNLLAAPVSNTTNARPTTT